MRIECEVCSATYTIDDAQLSDQPIGAQCPYCGHVKLVRRGDQLAAPPGFNPPSFGSSPFPSVPFQSQQQPQFAPPAGLAGAPPFGHPPQFGGNTPFQPNAPLGGAFGTGTAEDFGFTSPPPSPLASKPAPFSGGGGDGLSINPPARAPLPPPVLDAGGVDPFGSQSDGLAMPSPPDAGGGGNDRFAALEGFGGEAGAKCQVCGNALTDEFDKVIGLCDVHQRDRRGNDASASTTDTVKWTVRIDNGSVLGPFALEELRARIRQGEFTREHEYSKDGKSYARLSKYQEIAYLGNLAVADLAGNRPRPSFAPSGSKAGLIRMIAWAAGVVVILGIGLFGYRERARFGDLFTRLTKSTPGSSTSLNPVKGQLAAWRAKHGEVTGSASEHVNAARARYLEDTWKGYEAAETEFEKALLLDENDPTAIAGWIENTVIWKYPLLGSEEVKVAQTAVRYLLDVAPENGAVHRASAALALARGELDPCRAGADKALERDRTDGVAKLILAGCYLEGNSQLAISEAEQAARLVPDLRRADRVLASAYIKVGRFGSAQRVLEARLKTEPKNGTLHFLYGQLLRELEEYKGAATRFRQAAELGGDVQGAQLALADIYMEEGNHAGAIVEYKRVAEQKNAQPERLARALAGWAHGELMLKKYKDAARLAKAALEFSNKDAEALLVQGEAELLTGTATAAANLARRALEARTGEPAGLVLSARASAALNGTDRAIKQFEEAIANDPLDVRLKGILAALYLGIGGTQQAYTLMRKAAEIDPEERESRGRVGPFAINDLVIREAIDSFKRSAADEANASVANSSAGMLFYQIGDRARATEAINRALAIDESNVTALLYDAQLALDRKDWRRAESSGEKMLSIERGSALGHLMVARAFAGRGDIAQAVDRYRAALRSNPGLLAAQVELAGLDLKRGQKDSALPELARAFQVAPSRLVTRRLLFEAGY